MAWGEREAVALLSQVLGADRAGRAKRGTRKVETETGIGDDAAVIRVGGERLVWTIDDSEEGVHFDRRWLSLEDVGWRAFHAAVSDLAAMGAKPVAALCHLTLPASLTKAELRRVAEGQAEAADSLRCPLVGGNMSRGDSLKLTTTALGSVEEPILRSGARPGDELWLLGELGLARAGFMMLRGDGGVNAARVRGTAAGCLRAWRRPVALLDAGRALLGRATAAIDVSDGLGGDAAHLSESSGVRIVIDEERLEAVLDPALRAAAKRLGASAIELALAGGEDYALLATGPAKRRPRGKHAPRVIGYVDDESARVDVCGDAGVVLQQADGTLVQVPAGFDHLA